MLQDKMSMEFINFPTNTISWSVPIEPATFGENVKRMGSFSLIHIYLNNKIPYLLIKKMSTTKLQETIIEKVRQTSDKELLNYLIQLLNEEEGSASYKLSAFEKKMLAESEADYLAGRTISNEDVISRNEEWLKE
jgi:hypothetical protein